MYLNIIFELNQLKINESAFEREYHITWDNLESVYRKIKGWTKGLDLPWYYGAFDRF